MLSPTTNANNQNVELNSAPMFYYNFNKFIFAQPFGTDHVFLQFEITKQYWPKYTYFVFRFDIEINFMEYFNF